jgi:methylmalonyl-CoA mutase N-terminal domain/subunit
MREEFGAKNPRSWKLRFRTQTAGSPLPAPQPEINIIRVTVQALAAVLGGTQSLHTNSMDEALALPTEKAVQIALRTQQILAYEAGVGDTVDPLGGSYAIEKLTDEIEARAWDYIQRIEAMGGAVRAIEEGFMQREIQESAYRAQMAIESGEQIVVGVNKFVTAEEPMPELLRVDEAAQAAQIQQVQQLRAQRDQARVDAILARIEAAARTPDAPLMPLFVEAVEAYATLGEITDVLRQVFGEYRAPIVV